MGTTLSGPSVSPDEFTLSQLPFAAEDYAYDFLSIPHSICKACWQGPFARNLGLFCTSPREWYPPWREKNSYSTSFAKLQYRANHGCVWCRFVLKKAREANRVFGKRVIVKLWSVARRWFNYSGWRDWDHHHQALMIDINGVRSSNDPLVLSTAPGASGRSQAMRQHIELMYIHY